MAAQRALEFDGFVRATTEDVCRAFTQATMLRDWLCVGSSIGPVPGGHLFLRWRDGRSVSGRYQTIDPQREVAFSWYEPLAHADTQVRVSFTRQDDGVLVHLVQDIPEDDALETHLRQLWPPALENLASVVETGLDLRLVRRPRLGILMDAFTPEVAQRLGVPAQSGILIVDTAEGSGARAAGIVRNDVLVRLNGVALTDFDAFDPALAGLHAGDRPPVEFYRGAELLAVPLELGHFPVPDLPVSAPELAEAVGKLTGEMFEAIQADAVRIENDALAGKAPQPDEWSVKEIVAHFILCERDYQSWVADMLNDQPVEDSLLMRPNVTPRLRAAVARFATLPALLDELRLAFAETVNMLAALPEDFVNRRKHLYRRAAEWAINTPAHYHAEHKEQLQAAITAVQPAA